MVDVRLANGVAGLCVTILIIVLSVSPLGLGIFLLHREALYLLIRWKRCFPDCAKSGQRVRWVVKISFLSGI